METLQFSLGINASKERVWNTLWDDKTFRDWASIIDEGTYMKGKIKEGNEVQFISSVSEYGVTSLVEKLIPNEFVLFRHSVDTKESGEKERDKEWTGGAESYSLTEEDGVTTLTVEIGVPPEQKETFEVRLPKALGRVKILAEKTSIYMTIQNVTKSTVHVLIGTAFMLLIPLVLQLTIGTGVDGQGFNWKFDDFVVMGVLLFFVGLAIEIARKLTKPAYRGLIIATIVIIFILIYVELAVGIFGTPFAGS